MKVSATEASRGFSELLNMVAAGETVEVDRHGQTVAILIPPRKSTSSGFALKELIARLPELDEEFANDVAKLARITTQPRDHWPY